MREFGGLLYNEMEKIYRKKRLAVIILILAVLIPIFIYAEHEQAQAKIERLGTTDWKISLQQQISDSQNRLSNSNMPAEWTTWSKINIKQLQYYLDHNINPNVPGAASFTRGFLEQGIAMFIPLLVMIIAIDLISGEKTDGTIKLLITRPIRRWKILLSKYVVMILAVSLIILLVVLMSYICSGVVFGFKGLNMPVVTGFTIQNDQLITNAVHLIPQWKFILISAGLAWFVGVVVATLSFMVSALIRNTPAGMGIMFATLIAGGILKGLATNWEGAKYIYSVNLNLTDYLTGTYTTIKGMSMGFSLTNLTIWAVIALIISFLVFTKEDMMG